MKKTFQIHTLGCKVNQYESEQIRQVLLQNGYSLWQSSLSEPLNLAIVNTCAVTQESEAKSRKLTRQIIRRFTPQKVYVFGCSVTRSPSTWENLDKIVHPITGTKTGGNRVAELLQTLGIPQETVANQLETGLRQFGSRHRAYLKIQDGCQQFCTYCLIPYLRRELSSVPPEEVLAEAEGLLCRGYRELVLTGIHLGYYGQNIRSRRELHWQKQPLSSHQPSLPTLLASLAQLPFPQPFRIRISSLEAHEASDELLATMAQFSEKICPHLHLSMQSGSPTVHQRMNRPGTVEQYLERCWAAQKSLPGVALTTDVIVGFPGETETEFLETCDVVQQIGFSKIHIFPYSPRPGTPAASLHGQIPQIEKQRRVQYLAQIEKNLHDRFLQQQTGKKIQVLVETWNPQTQYVTGTSEHYLRYQFPGKSDWVGTFLNCLAPPNENNKIMMDD
ncbi:MAG: MiaB/RimO family radical SAM methylthiotransferase [Planctomycetia bacterium]|nr:MiaB/RimO family radical SAM methylthiotransferase [Planctomycetia bacterium]